MNHASLNISDIFDICMCCGYSIYCLTVTIASMVIPQAAIERGVHMEYFLGGLRVYWWGLIRSILVGT